METAMAMFPQHTFAVTWQPFLLRPNAPREGVLKSPDTPDNPRVGARMKGAGQAVGIDFTGKCDRAPNSITAHCLLKYVNDEYGSEVQNKVQERLFEAYFTDGIYPDVDNLVTLVTTLDPAVFGDGAKVRKVLESQDLEKQVVSEARQNSQLNGVPYFIINGQPAFSGAQDPSAFAQVFNQC